MEKVRVRMGANLTFDADKERDIIELVNNATSKHKLSDLVTNLLRIYVDNPEELNNNRKSIEKLLDETNNEGISANRQKFFEDITKQIDQMKQKVDIMYDKCLELNTMVMMGKRLGMEERTENSLLATFMLEKQLTDLYDTFGVKNIKHQFNSNKLLDTQEKSEEILEYIINSYDGIFTELRNMGTQVVQVSSNGGTVSNVGGAVGGGEVTKITGVPLENTEDTEEEVGEPFVDFGDADLGALERFFG